MAGEECDSESEEAEYEEEEDRGGSFISLRWSDFKN